MKNTIALLPGFLIILMLGRCGDPIESLTLSHEEVAEMTATAIAKSTYGLALIVDTSLLVTTRVVEAGNYCDHVESNTFTSTDSEDDNDEYSCDYTYKMSCIGTSPQNSSIQSIFKGQFDSDRLTCKHMGMAELITTGLNNTSANYTVKGDYETDGTYTSHISDRSEGNNSIAIRIADVVIRKSDNHVISGTANVVISGFFADKRPYNAGAAVTFNNDNTFTVNVRGVRFSVDIHSGVVKQISE